MAAVLTTSMTLRIVLSVRGTLAHGGSFALSASTHTGSSRSTHVISTRSNALNSTDASARNPNHHHHPSHPNSHTYTLDQIHSANSKGGEGEEWGVVDTDTDAKSSVAEAKGTILPLPSDDGGIPGQRGHNLGVKITVDREVDYDEAYLRGK